MKTAITVRGLRKAYRRVKRRFLFIPVEYERVEALKGISFSVKQGEILGYLGPNGSGKSTTMKILAGIMRPDGGSAEVMGYVPWERENEYLQRIGVMFGQRSALLWDLPVIDGLLLLKDIYDVDDRTFKEQLELADAYLGIGEFLSTPLRKLSLGQRMRCEFAAAIIHDPDVLFLDEPMIGIDVWTRQRIKELLRTLASAGKTIVITTHQIEDIEAIATQIAIIWDGQIEFQGSPDQLREIIPYKKMYIEFSREKEPLPYPVVRRTGRSVLYNVPRAEMSRAIGLVQDRYEIIDMSIHEPALEDILIEWASSRKKGLMEDHLITDQQG